MEPALNETFNMPRQLGASLVSPAVAIIILNWNNAPDTIECLTSVARLAYDNFHVIVVDNGSTDGSVEQLREANLGVEIIALDRNLGYAEGNNVGIRQAVQRGADYIFVLNNDTLVAPTMLAELVRFAMARPKIGMLGPKMYCTDPENTLFATGSFINWAKGETYNRDMFQVETPRQQPDSPQPVDFITGCGVLVRREVIETIGGLDPLYFLNYEDVEWCVRMQRHGFEIWFVPQAVMWHKVSATLGQASPANTYYMTRNALLFFGRNAPVYIRWLSISRIILRTLRTVGAWTLKVQYKTDTFRRLRQANLLALRDFFLGRFGQMGADVAAICYPNR